MQAACCGIQCSAQADNGMCSLEADGGMCSLDADGGIQVEVGVHAVGGTQVSSQSQTRPIAQVEAGIQSSPHADGGGMCSVEADGHIQCPLEANVGI